MKVLYIVILIIVLTSCRNININNPNYIIEKNIEENEKYYWYDSERFAIKMQNNNDIEQFKNVISETNEIINVVENFHAILHKVEIEINEVNYDVSIYKPEKKIKIPYEKTSEKAYNKKLISCLYGIKEPWIVEGLYCSLFEEGIPINFQEFFKDNELSFFGARFYEKFNSKDEISNLQYASKTLVDFIISNYSIDDLISGRMDFEKIKPWFEKHNIDSKYQESIDKFMNVFEFSSSNLKPLIMKSEKLSYTVLNIDPQWDRANKIETFIVHDKDDRNKIHKIIKDEAPRFYDEFLKGKVDSIALNYELNKSKKGSFADKNLDNKIYLGSLSANTHEYIHILLANRLDFVNWLHEGLAQYFPFLYFDEPISSYIEFINYDVELFAKERSLTEKEKQEFLRMRNTVIDNFTNRGGVWPIDNNVKDDKQSRLFMDAFAYYELKLDDYFTVSEVYGDRINLTRDKTGTFLEADELSYLQALSFTNYLIGNFGLEKMLYISQESPSAVSFEEDFGKSYGELKKDWLNSIGF